MSAGNLQVHTYTSNAQIPLQDVAITITDSNKDAIAMGLTNRNGMLDSPIKIQTPPLSSSQQPTTGPRPFAVVDIYARLSGFEEVFVKNVQIFDDIITLQNIELIPLAEFPDSWTKGETFDTAQQNL